ncbi:helix-turn-helix transcriptional regulator [Solihabitans fulvus]|uniref:Helix-turn-helix transcriptional regulator n=1 Tax=Solihabitans fulvus TaxID=1892852 RepID=A0A5B2X7V7_9PSEU|nr:helix-turn-helix domain-containing protein [Solihabitans fulvus]KAA2259497.1 helix-turn-helix transcriptional regulator [Solihabitans fulvus]
MDTALDLRDFGGVDAYLAKCPSRTVLDVLANKWAVLVVPMLGGGPLRFGVLRRKLDGITQKSLTQTLRNLERDGLVTRTAFPTIPPRVEYELTSLGRSAITLLEGMRVWAEQHVPEIVNARSAYAQRAEAQEA